METTITMTACEQYRAWVLTKVLTGELTMIEGAERLGAGAPIPGASMERDGLRCA